MRHYAASTRLRGLSSDVFLCGFRVAQGLRTYARGVGVLLAQVFDYFGDDLFNLLSVSDE